MIRRQIGNLSLQVLCLQMCVTLCGGHPGVAQQFLHSADVGPGAEGMGSERMPENMRAGAVGDAGRPQIPIHQQRNAAYGEAVLAVIVR